MTVNEISLTVVFYCRLFSKYGASTPSCIVANKKTAHFLIYDVNNCTHFFRKKVQNTDED